MTNLEQRVIELERQVAQLTELHQAELAVKAVAPRPRAIDDRGVRITYLAEPNAFQMPGEDDLKTLYEIVLNRCPYLCPSKQTRPFIDDNDRDGFKDFCNSFLRLGNLGRADKPNQKLALSWWLQECGDWLSPRSLPKISKADAFLAAVIAHGDIPYVAPANDGSTWEFALEPYSRGRRATDGWRKVLGGEILTPLRRYS